MATPGLVLTGGGARGAYQAGALRAISDITKKGAVPFKVIAGASAGAINSAALAAGAKDFDLTTQKLWDIWSGLELEQVIRTDTMSLAGIGFHLLKDVLLGGIIKLPSSTHLLDSAPLRELLAARIDFPAIGKNIDEGILRGIAITATNYLSGTSITFFDSAEEIKEWIRSRRLSRQASLGVDHVIASAAIPLFFPPIKLSGSYYGDGCIRLSSPLSPAIHLGADKILAIGIRYVQSNEEIIKANQGEMDEVFIANIFGLLLNSIFMDSLEADMERLHRVNRTVATMLGFRRKALPDQLRQIPAMTLSPSRDLGALASDQFKNFPRTLRHLLKGIGAGGKKGGELLSYITFDGRYTVQLLECGYDDAMKRKDEIIEFLAE